MPGPDDRTGDFWKDQDVNPTQCGSCASQNIGLVGDFFTCKACGFQWAKREEPKPDVPSINEVVSILARHLLAERTQNSREALLDVEAEVLSKWVNQGMVT